jgi:sodium/proline symporter
VFISCPSILFNPWIAGVLLSAILAAIMSTLSCQLLVCSSALTEDFYRPSCASASQRELVWVGRAMVLADRAGGDRDRPQSGNRVLGLVSPTPGPALAPPSARWCCSRCSGRG